MPGPIRGDLPVVTPLELGDQRLKIDPGPSAASFGDLFKNAINDASGMQNDGQNMIGAVLRGEPVALHHVTAANEEAATSLKPLVQIPNELCDAYRTVMN